MASGTSLASAIHSVLEDIEKTDPRVGSAALVAAGLLEVGSAIREAAGALAKPLSEIAFEATAIRRKGVAQSLEARRDRPVNGSAAPTASHDA